MLTFYQKITLVKTDCISHGAYAIFQAIRGSELVVVDSIKLNKEARISVSVNCKKGTLLWLGDEWQQWHLATGFIIVITVSQVPENYLWAKWIMKFVIKTCQLRQIWLFRLKNIAFHIVMAFPDDQVEEISFWILRTSPTISIIIAAFKVDLNDVIATFYGFSGPFYRNASRCLKIRFWIDFGRLTDFTSFVWKEILIWLNRDSLHYFTAECSRG